MRCPACGEGITDEGEVCPHCGTVLSGDPAAPSTARATDDRAGTTALFGLERNLAAALSYSATFLTGFVFYSLADDEFVRFHAAQSVIAFGTLFGASLLLEAFGAALASSFALGPTGAVLLGIVSSLLGLFGFGLWILLGVQAYRGKWFALPVAGRIALEYA